MGNVVDASKGLDRAVAHLSDGGLVAVPTETVYGLAADATNAEAVAGIYKAKGRPSFNPLIIHVDGPDMASRYGWFDDVAGKLVAAFWPGPLTLVVPLAVGHNLAAAVTANLTTVAIRQPHGVMAELARRLGRPLAAPSANSSGRISPTQARHVADDLGHKVDLILDNGPCPVGLESTIVSITDGTPTVLREGGVPRDAIEAVMGPVATAKAEGAIQAPGMMLAHYAPRVPLRMDAIEPHGDELLLGFGPDMDHATLNLSANGDVEEAARNLFAMLQQLDAGDARAIAVAPVPSHGLGAAINDRLRRAAHGSKGNDDGR